MSSNAKNTQVIIRGNEFILPRAAKPMLVARPKPAPSPSSKKANP